MAVKYVRQYMRLASQIKAIINMTARPTMRLRVSIHGESNISDTVIFTMYRGGILIALKVVDMHQSISNHIKVEKIPASITASVSLIHPNSHFKLFFIVAIII